MSESESKKLSELRVVDLRAELEKRGLDKNGVKKDLVERLQKALQSEGLDPESHIFDLGDKKQSKRLSSSFQGDDCIMIESAEGDAEKTEDGEKIQDDDVVKLDTSQGTEKVGENGANRDKTDLEPEVTINLTLDDDENINEESAEQAVDKSRKSRQETDEKTTSTEHVPVEETKETTTASTTQTSKKNQDGVGTSPSVGDKNDEVAPQKKAPSNPRILWITNVPKNTRANELKQLLSQCGKVVCAKVVVNARFPGSCCFGYITMGTAEDATNVITKLNNTEFNGQIIKIDKFENIKADNLNPVRKKAEELKKTQLGEKKDDKAKRTPEDPEEEGYKCDDVEQAGAGSDDSCFEIRESPTSDRSSRGRRRTPSGERFRERDRPYHRPVFHDNVLTFDKIKEERERQRLRDRERALREDSRRRHEEQRRLHEMREITRRQRHEAERLEREREKLRVERERIEREKTELIKLERERQKLEREKLEMEKMELQRSRLRLEEDKRSVKRPAPMPYRREETFEERKRAAGGERHFEEQQRFEPSSHASEVAPPKKFAPSKDFKRLYEKNEPFLDKRGRDFNSDRSLQNTINRSNNSLKYDRSFERDDPSRQSQTNLSIRSKDGRYSERDRSPHFRPMQDNRDRHIPNQGKPGRERHYTKTNAPERWHPGPPQSKFGSNNQKPWANKGGTWRSDPPSGDRWNPGTGSSGRSSISQQFSGNSNLAPTCPPPPGINNYSDRFDYNKSSGVRKY